MNEYDENDNQNIVDNTDQPQNFKMPCVNMELYSSAYVGSTGQKYTKKGQKKKSGSCSFVKRVAASVVCGILFGMCAAASVYVLINTTNFGNRLIMLDEKLDTVDAMKQDVEASVETVDAIRNDVQTAADNIAKQSKQEEEKAQNESEEPKQITTTVVTDVTEVVKTAMPSVVSIIGVSGDDEMYNDEQSSMVNGSGIIVGETEDELLIATNYHVVNGSEEILVKFVDDAEQTAYIKGTDEESDIAVLTVFMSDIGEDTKNSISVAVFGDSDNLQIGEPAIAIGDAMGYGQSVTTGVISAVNREFVVDERELCFIQTDAAINPGNSGGALLNVKGEVIGINSNKIADYVIEGMGYAIPIAKAKPIIDELTLQETRKKAAKDERAFLGIAGTDVTSDVIEKYNMPEGVYIEEVMNNTGAQKAGIQKGDILTSFDGEKITQMEQLRALLEYYTAGTEVEVGYMRQSDGGYKEATAKVTLSKNQENKLKD